MDADAVRELCLSFPGAYEDFPFGPETAVFKVRSPASAGSAVDPKMFALMQPGAEPPSVSLKCDPALAVQLRAAHPEIRGAWHLNKKHWNGVRLDGDLGNDAIRDMVEDSYDLVVASLPKGQREALGWSGLVR
jgi:predicted DNA-binding protein (MmcQ/YjbR family)